MVVVWLALCALVAGCGRIGFDARDEGDATLMNGPCPTFAIFCDDFESGDLSRWTTTKIAGPGMAVVQSATVRRGTFALEASMSAGQTPGAASPEIALGAQSTGVLAAREWINVSTKLENFALVLELKNNSGDFTNAGGNGSGNWASADGRMGAGTTYDHDSVVPVPALDTWICVELMLAFGQPTRIQVFVDDAQVLQADAVDPQPTYSVAGVGMVRSADQLAFHMFADDIAVARQRIGCN